MFAIEKIKKISHRVHREDRGQKKSRAGICLRTALCFIAIFFITSFAQARSRDQGGDPGSGDQSSQASAAASQRSAPAAQASQRESRTDAGDRGQRTDVRRQDSDVTSQNTRTQEHKNSENRIVREAATPEKIAAPITPSIERAQVATSQATAVKNHGQDARGTQKGDRGSPLQGRATQPMQSEVRIKESTQKTEIAAPITPSVERAQPSLSKTATANKADRPVIIGHPTQPTVTTKSVTPMARSEARRQIVVPLSEPIEVSTSADRGQRTEDRSQNTRTQEHKNSENRIGREAATPEKIAAPSAAAPTTERPQQQTTAGASNENRQRLAPKNPIQMAPANPISMKPTSVQKLAPENPISMTQKNPTSLSLDAPRQPAPTATERATFDRTHRRENIVRGTGQPMTADRVVNGRTNRTTRRDTTIINDNRTVVNNFGDQHSGRDDHFGYDRDRGDGHDNRWWNGRNHYNRDDHHRDGHHYDGGHRSSFFLGLGFYSGYAYSAWAPVYYEPAYYPVAAYGPVWPYRTIVYGYGPHCGVSYVYPGYHRRYVFMSVGGYWPCYPYARYYWYDYHPWYWYGAEPVAYQIDGGDNYYTYNYYGSDTTSPGVSSTGPLTPGTIVNGVEVPDYDALKAAGRQVTVPPQAAQQTPPQQPAAPTESDKLFDAGVTTFGDGNYPGAIEKFQRAVRLEPNDVILPFAYAQALFANTDYEQAAAVLQTALAAMAPAKPEVFFPRGLYKDDTVLTEQIKSLERAVMMNPANSGLQLLYGYQLVGIGKADEAKVPLGVAQRDPRTAGSASVLLNLIERVKAESQKKK